MVLNATELPVDNVTVTVVALLSTVNTLLLLVCTFFVRDFIKDMKKVAEEVRRLDKQLALLAQHVRFDIATFAEDGQQ